MARKSEDILLALIIQVTYFGEIPNFLTVIGAITIFICIVLTALRRIAQKNAKAKWIKKVFCIDEQEGQRGPGRKGPGQGGPGQDHKTPVSKGS